MRKKYLGLICLVYAGIILFVNHYNILRNFLAPNMQVYLKASIIPLIIIGLVILFSDHFHYKFKIIDIFLLLPIAMLIIAGDGRLTTDFASNRSMNINSKKTTKNVEKDDKKDEPVSEKKEIDVDKVDLTEVDFDVKDESYLDLANFLTYNPKALNYEGKTIRVRGFTIDNTSYLPDGYFGLGKYGVSCCTADAGFTGFVVSKSGHSIKANTWYEIEGVFEKIQDLAGYDILSIKLINIKEIDGSKEEQYVYPCYSYDDGACTEMKKYNLQY